MITKALHSLKINTYFMKSRFGCVLLCFFSIIIDCHLSNQNKPHGRRLEAPNQRTCVLNAHKATRFSNPAAAPAQPPCTSY